MHLSEQTHDDRDSLVGVEPTGAPVHELTPAMIDAGVDALLDFRDNDSAMAVRAIYDAICRAHAPDSTAGLKKLLAMPPKPHKPKSAKAGTPAKKNPAR